ncbi:MAG TPA: M15 family metallopeptidase [Vicinamibacteria bacterium]|nr:M15 family metallopeptidase [Vicinamibacteria bacterium]
MTLSSVAGTVLWFAQIVAPTPAPSPCPPEWIGLLGLYGAGDNVLLILERDGALEGMVKGGRFYALEKLGPDRFRFPNVGRLAARQVVFSRDATGKSVSLRLDEALLPRDPGSDGAVPRAKPARPVDELVREARAASPPVEPPAPLPSDLVDVKALDPSIEVDLRYAGEGNPAGERLLKKTSRAFLQRPAAEALVRAHRALAPLGYGLVVRDAYHPWWVTTLVWEASPPEVRRFLADPPDGSGYNRGTTVDVGLYRLADRHVVELPSPCGEMSVRANPDFPGGTSEQRWRRDLLQEAMETAGLSSSATQWWRYDLPQGRKYPILNVAPDEP